MAEFKGKQGHWVTTESGSHLFIESGGTFEEAVEQAFGKENAKKYKKGREEILEYGEEDEDLKDLFYKASPQEAANMMGKPVRANGKIYRPESEEDEFNKQNSTQDFDNDYESYFEDNSQRADFIVENNGDLELTDNEFDQVEDILGDEKRAAELKNIVKDNLDLGDGEEQAIRNALENFKEEQKSESIDFDNDPFFQELYGQNDDDWSKWAEKTDKSVPNNWTSNGWDGDTRFYKVSNQNGVESVSIKPNGIASVYTTDGYIAFDSMEEAQKFMNAKNKEEATNLAWERGWLDGSEERAINDMFGSDNDFDNDLEAAFKKHGADEDAILDELRASGKDYGMSNGDLQGVVEAYVMNHGGTSLPQNREQFREKAFNQQWEKLSKAVEDDDVDAENEALDEIQELLPFKNRIELDKWLDKVATWNDWDEFEEYTRSILNRGKK